MTGARFASGAPAVVFSTALVAPSSPPAHARAATPAGEAVALLPFAARGFGMEARPAAPTIVATAT